MYFWKLNYHVFLTLCKILNPLTLVPSVTGLCSTCDLIYNKFSRRRPFQWYPAQSNLLNGARKYPWKCSQIRVTLAAKFPATTLSYSMVKIACLDDFSEIFFNWKQEGQSLQQNDTKRRKRKEKKLKHPNFDFCACCHVANAFFSRLKLTWLTSRLDVDTM